MSQIWLGQRECCNGGDTGRGWGYDGEGGSHVLSLRVNKQIPILGANTAITHGDSMPVFERGDRNGEAGCTAMAVRFVGFLVFLLGRHRSRGVGEAVKEESWIEDEVFGVRLCGLWEDDEL